MATTIEVNKQSVKQLLETGKANSFIIPEYQRPYAWGIDQIETLFEDLWEFTASIAGTDSKSTYFLGSVVSYENEKGEQEIIDGQQRITSLFLLLRAIYTKLKEADTPTKETLNFMSQIEPAIWRTNKFSGEVDYSSILLESRVMNNEGNQILREILKTGTVQQGANDNYSKNYKKLQELFDKACEENALMIYEFIYVLLNQAILLPITADTQDTALTIFSTLNDRGLPLSDADIFKAKIYNRLDVKEKATFIEQWKELDEKAMDTSEIIQQLFYYYMFYLRALERDTKTTTPGLRKYYSEDKFQRLESPDLLKHLKIILNVWSVIARRESMEEEAWSTNPEVLQTLDILSSYPNEYWKYPVVIYYLAHREEIDFEIHFLKFLRKLLIELVTRYLITPTINAVKSDILKLNTAIIDSAVPEFAFKEIDLRTLKQQIRNPHRNIVRMLLKILAYEEQTELLPFKWEIEHIFPQKWKRNYSDVEKMDDEVIKEKIEHIGNKLPIEKKLNIVAGNDYYLKKKEIYMNSKIAITKEIGRSQLDNWNLDNIVERDIRVSDFIIKTFEQWNKEYLLP